MDNKKYEEYKKIILKGDFPKEDEYVEYKSYIKCEDNIAFEKAKNKIIETISAFANLKGGIIVIGVNDKKNERKLINLKKWLIG